MIERFYPNEYIDSVYELDINKFKKKGISAFVFDIDNTLAPFFVKIPDGRVRRFFERLKKNGTIKEKELIFFAVNLMSFMNIKRESQGLGGLKKCLSDLRQNLLRQLL